MWEKKTTVVLELTRSEAKKFYREVYRQALADLKAMARGEDFGLTVEPKRLKDRLKGIQCMRSLLDKAESCILSLSAIKKGRHGVQRSKAESL